MPENQIEKFLSKIYGAATLYGLQGSGKTLSLVWLMNIRSDKAEIYTNQSGITGFETHPIRSDADVEYALNDKRKGVLSLDEAQEILDSRQPWGNIILTRLLALSRKRKKLAIASTQFEHLLDKRFKDQSLYQLYPMTYADVKGKPIPTIGTWDLMPDYMTLEVWRRNVKGVLQPYATGYNNPLIQSTIPDYVFDLWDHYEGTYDWYETSKHEKDIKKHVDLIRERQRFLLKEMPDWDWTPAMQQTEGRLPKDLVGLNGGTPIYEDVLGCTWQQKDTAKYAKIVTDTLHKNWIERYIYTKTNGIEYWISWTIDNGKTWEGLKLDKSLAEKLNEYKSSTIGVSVLRKFGAKTHPIPQM